MMSIKMSYMVEAGRLIGYMFKAAQGPDEGSCPCNMMHCCPQYREFSGRMASCTSICSRDSLISIYGTNIVDRNQYKTNKQICMVGCVV